MKWGEGRGFFIRKPLPLEQHHDLNESIVNDLNVHCMAAMGQHTNLSERKKRGVTGTKLLTEYG